MDRYPLNIADDDEITGVSDARLTITTEVEMLARRPYRMVVWHDDENGWAAVIPDLPGLAAAGETIDEMLAVAEEAKRLWIAAALAEGRSIPTPHEAITLA